MEDNRLKTLYFDCSSGISGNMTLGALTEIVGDENYLIDELKKLNLNGYKIEISKKIKNGITGTYVDVILEDDDYAYHHHGHEHGNDCNRVHEEEHGHGHDDSHVHEEEHGQGHDDSHVHEEEHGHGHDDSHVHEEEHSHGHTHRNLHDINRIIDNSTLDDKVKSLAKRIFLRVAKAEAKVHHKSLEEVHFHEVGAIDSIVDIVGTAILIHKISPDRIKSSVVNDGYGFINCAHGMMAVPVPATSEIFSEANVKFRQIEISTELVTPTGAAIIAELANDFNVLPEMKIEKIGWGSGSKDLKIPNVLKIYWGDEGDYQNLNTTDGDITNEMIVVMETNIDDCTGEILGYTMEKLLESGAKDVFYTPIFMKKNRPAYRLTVVCTKEDIDLLQGIIFNETTTIGIRYRYEYRTVLEREEVDVETKYGKVSAKKVFFKGKEFIYPEYESVKKIAEESHISLKEIYRLS
ncbi:MAG: nickel pincer cofactor biosynthesis protein LarC [Lachnospiraceae bacterium]|nr:nickel pincer cofactor biosynthesis protein LarC [Lachnospiraceae bacterium]